MNIGQQVRFIEAIETEYGTGRGTVIAIEGQHARVRWARRPDCDCIAHFTAHLTPYVDTLTLRRELRDA